jgi:TetR/AcrR family transcriptional repressor of lmrAB and yxaGH operons
MSSSREQILEATRRLMEAQGYHATGLSQIIEESGAPRGSLYYYFPGGKEALAAEVVRRTGEEVEARIRAVLQSIDDPAEAMRQFIARVIEHMVASDYRAGGPITTVALESATTSDPINAACQEVYESWRLAFGETLIRSGIDEARASSLSALIVAALEGGIVMSRTAHQPEPLVRVAEEIARLLQISTA